MRKFKITDLEIARLIGEPITPNLPILSFFDTPKRWVEIQAYYDIYNFLNKRFMVRQ